MTEAKHAQDCPPSSGPAKSAFFRPSVSGRMRFSTEFEFISIWPSSGNGRLTLDDFRQSFDLERGEPGVGPFGTEDWPALEAHLKETGWAP